MTAPIQQVTDEELKEAIIERQLVQAEEIEKLLTAEAENTAQVEEQFHGKLFLVDPLTHQLIIKTSQTLEEITRINLSQKPSSEDFEQWGSHLALIEQTDHSYQGPLAKNNIEPYGLVLTPSLSYAYLSELGKSNFLGLVDSYCFGYNFKNDVEHGPFDLFLSPDRNFLAVTDRAGGNVNIVDTKSNQLISTIKVRDSGSKKALNLVFDMDNQRMIVTDNQSPSFKCIDMNSFELSEHNAGL